MTNNPNILDYGRPRFDKRRIIVPLVITSLLASIVVMFVSIRQNYSVLGLASVLVLLAALIPVLIRNLGTAASSAFFMGLAFLATILIWGLSLITSLAHVHWYVCIIGGIGTLAIPMLIENVLLRLLENTRVGAVARVTYYEAILHPFTLIVVVVAMLFLFIMCFVPFYTFNEEQKFYRELASSVSLLAALVIMIFGSAKVIDEEIESRTMLTLMSKPISRWQVILGKYIGVVCLIFVVLATLGLLGAICNYLRYYDDMRIDLGIAGNRAEYNRLMFENVKGALAMGPLAALAFLQVVTLAAISVAVSTRWGLALNVTVVALLYILANLARLLPDAEGIPQPWRAIVVHLSYILPYLGNFDLTQALVYREFTITSLGEAARPGILTFGEIWRYVGIVTIDAALYITAALGLATAMFRTRELT